MGYKGKSFVFRVCLQHYPQLGKLVPPYWQLPARDTWIEARPWRRYLEGIEAGDDSAVLHMAAPGGVGELALGVRPRAGASLKFATHFQGQPFSVASHSHADGHRVAQERRDEWAGKTTKFKKIKTV